MGSAAVARRGYTHCIDWGDPAPLHPVRQHPHRTRMATSLPVLLLLSLQHSAGAEIIKPMGEWLCNYCAMGPQEKPEDCGTPILCMFYGLILFIIALTIYTTIKGTTE